MPTSRARGASRRFMIRNDTLIGLAEASGRVVRKIGGLGYPLVSPRDLPPPTTLSGMRILSPLRLPVSPFGMGAAYDLSIACGRSRLPHGDPGSQPRIGTDLTDKAKPRSNRGLSGPRR